MKYNRLVILASAALILAVVATGSAFAKDCFNGNDSSQVNQGGLCSWIGNPASGYPPESSGTLVEWKNCLANKDTDKTSYYPQVQFWDTTRSQTFTVSKGSVMHYNDPAWTPLVGNTQTRSGSYTGIIHIYQYVSGGGTGISKTGNQHSWTIS